MLTFTFDARALISRLFASDPRRTKMWHRTSTACPNSVKICASLTFLSFSLSMVLLNHNMLASSLTASDMDPAGTECLYSISLHLLQCTSNSSRQTVPIIVGPENVTSGVGGCRDNPQCVGRKYKWVGPIEPGKYRMSRDTRAEGAERLRLEPIPPRPGWRVRLPSWMPGSLRGGFLLTFGTYTHGCIIVRKEDDKARAQYEKVLQMLEAESHAGNHLLVMP